MVIGSDFHNAGGQVIGRAEIHLPDASTSEERAEFFEAMAKIERAEKVELDPSTMRPKRIM